MPLAISIIIPAFDIEAYLTPCLDSIVHQVNDNVEIIIVDDGSTDSTGSIADSFALEYDFIEVIHQSNQGVSVARNRGLLEATGDYVWFVDGDDFIADGAIALLIKWLKDDPVDIIFFKNLTFFTETKGFFSYAVNNTKFTKNNFINHISDLKKQGLISYSSCDKVVKRDLLVNNNINFDTELTYSEDYLWNYQLFKAIKRFSYTNQTFYFYRKNRVGSATTQLTSNHLDSAMKALTLSVKDIVTNYSSCKKLLLFSSQVFFYTLPEFYRIGVLNKSIEADYYDVYQIYKKNNVQLSAFNRGAKTFDKLYRVLPWRYTIRLYSQLINIRRYLQSTLLKQTK